MFSTILAITFLSASAIASSNGRNCAKPAGVVQADVNLGLSNVGNSVSSNSVSSAIRASDLPTTANVIIAAAQTVDDGNYILTNVATGANLTYARAGQQLYPDQGAGSPLTLKQMGDSYTVIKPTDANNKCASAQWDEDTEGGVDWAAALYACKVFTFNKRNVPNRIDARAVQLRLAKQYWYLVQGSTQGAYKIIPVDHLLDQNPRAMDSGTRVAKANGVSKYPALSLLDNTDLSQEWYLTAQ